MGGMGCMGTGSSSSSSSSAAMGAGAAGGGTSAGRVHMTLDLEHSCVLKRMVKDRENARSLRDEADRVRGRISALKGMVVSEMSDGDFDELKLCRSRLDCVERDAGERRGWRRTCLIYL